MKTIPIEEIPRLSKGIYPYEEWLGIPVGRAVEIGEEWPELLNGTSPSALRMRLSSMRKRYPQLRVFQRGSRVYIARVAEDE